jgi:hypothetical protein
VSVSVRPTEALGAGDVEVGQEWYRLQGQRLERRRCRVIAIDGDAGKVLMERSDGVDRSRRWESMGNLLSRWKLVAEATVAP